MEFVTIEDLYGSCEMIVFENCYNKSAELLVEENIVIIEGRLSIREDQDITIIASKISEFNDNEGSCKDIILNINELDEEHKEKLRQLIRFYARNKETANTPISVKQGEKVSSCGKIFADEDVIKKIEEIVGKEKVEIK